MQHAPPPEGSPELQFSFSLQTLLFGAIAMNLITLMCTVIYVGGYFVLLVVAALFIHFLRGITLFAIAVAGLAIVSQLAQLFAWGARGFVEVRLFRIAILGIFFTLYGISAVKTGLVDGYVALGTVGITSLVVILKHWRPVLSYLGRRT
jgi:hypothetical protein